MSVGRGEIVGITGLAGSGFEEVPYLRARASRTDGGVLTLGDRSIDLAAKGAASVENLIGAGVSSSRRSRMRKASRSR